jgi:ABC-type branched-subunit amino acid transport system substrate-binding protein
MAKKNKTFDPFLRQEVTEAPSKCADVVVITPKYTYQGKLIAYGKQDGIVKRVLVDSNSFLRGAQWESVHDVFEVE